MVAQKKWKVMATFLLLLFGLGDSKVTLGSLFDEAAAGSLTYHSPGDILPEEVDGISDRRIWFRDWKFPLSVGNESGLHAYMGTQLSRYHGLPWNNDPRLFTYPHRDNHCEPRSSNYLNIRCPKGVGHQGVDIRAHDNRDNTWEVLAVEDGVVTMITKNTTVAVRNGNHTVMYLHMDPASIKEAGITKPGQLISKGQALGRVSCFMGGKCNTSQHLHIHAYTGTLAAGNLYNVYPSLIAAYREAWGLDRGITEDGELIYDPEYELAEATLAGSDYRKQLGEIDHHDDSPISTASSGADRMLNIVEATNNFLLLTFPMAEGEIDSVPNFVLEFPGFERQASMISDNSRYYLPAFSRPEQGLAFAWAWLRKMAEEAGYENYLTPRLVAHRYVHVSLDSCNEDLLPTADSLARKPHGSFAIEDCELIKEKLSDYVGDSEYTGIAEYYFRRELDRDERLDLNDIDTQWNWIRTMYSSQVDADFPFELKFFEQIIESTDEYLLNIKPH